MLAIDAFLYATPAAVFSRAPFYQPIDRRPLLH